MVPMSNSHGRNYLLVLVKLLVAIAILIIIFLGFLIFSSPFSKGSVVVYPTGGLGNQMFQYAAAYSLAKKSDSKLYVVVSRKKAGKIIPSGRNFPLGQFNIPQESIIYKDQINGWFVFKGVKLDWIFNKITNASVKNSLVLCLNKLNEELKLLLSVVEVNEGNIFDYKNKKNQQILYSNDNFESEIYFEDVKDGILKIFTYKNVENKKILDLITEVNNEHSVCIHVRRGDMVNSPAFFLPIDYQKQAIELVQKMIEKPKFFVFSDSPEMVKSELKAQGLISFIEGSSWDDFVVMSKCTNIIIANSTFSWWAAYLNQNKNHLVVAPYPRVNDIFFKDVSDSKKSIKRNLYKYNSYPKHWITLEYITNDIKHQK